MKKVIKIAGNVLMIGALAFIVKKILDMDIDPAEFRSPAVIVVLVLAMFTQAVLMTCGCYPWLVFIRSLSGRKIPFSAAVPVYTKSNVLKYLPGNVFQYVGRNKLAFDMEISHVDVVCGTVLDIMFSAAWAGIIAVVLLGGKIAGLLGKYGKLILIAGMAGVVCLLLLILLVRLKFRGKLREYLARYAKALEKENRLSLFSGIFYYLLHNLFSAVMYFLCLRLIIGDSVSFGELLTLTGAFMFAWLVGFVTPGAPGGIGIRESVMLFVSGDNFSDKIMLFVLVMRVGSVFGDVLAYLFGKVFDSVVNKKPAGERYS